MISNGLLNLYVFGGIRLTRDALELRGAGTRRKPLAMLAFLAVNSRGVSRDKLAAFLWPEADTDAARTALRQTLYSLRRDLDAPDLIVGNIDLRLNPEIIGSDWLQFEEALEQDDLDAAAALYKGPFLDGFHLPDATEFERWQDAERSRCDARVRAAVEALAARADRRRDKTTAVRWWTRLTELDPLSGSAAAGLMNSLAEAGDAARAIRHADEHDRYVRNEIGAAADSSVTTLATRLRSELPATPPAVEVVDSSAPAPQINSTSAAPSAAPKMRIARPLKRRAAILVAIPAVVALGVAEFGLGGWARGNTAIARESTIERTAQTSVAILPFTVTGTDATLPFLKEGLADLLAAKFGGVAGLTIIDPRVSVEAWRSTANAGETPLARAIDIGRRLGAEQVLTGTVIGTAGRIQLAGRVTMVRGTGIAVETAVAGPPDSLIFLIDQLAAALLTLAEGEAPGRVKSITRSPLSAVKAYLSGQRAYRDGRYDEAANRFRDAVQLDSTFALAAFRLALASGWAGRATAEGDSATERAWAARDRLIPRDFAFLKAFATGRIPQLHANRQEVYGRWENAVSEVPDWPEVWLEYADRFFHEPHVPFDVTSHARAAAALRRALELDSMFLPAIPHAVQLAAVGSDTATVRRLARLYLSRDSSSGTAEYVRWRSAHALSDSVTVRRMRAAFYKLPRTALRSIIQAAHFDGVGNADAAVAAQALISRGGSTEELIEAYLFAHDAALNAGRPADALAALDGIAAAQPTTYDADRRRVLDALYSIGDTLAASAAEARIAISAEGPIEKSLQARAMQYRNMCVHAQWRLSRSDLPAVTRMISRLANVDNPDRVVPQSARGEVGVCRALLQAMASGVVDRAALRTRLAALDSVTTAASPGDALAYFPIARSRLYAQSGDTAVALTAVRERIYFAFNPAYLPAHLRDEGRYAIAVGDTAGAVRALRHFLALRRGAVGRPGAEVAEVQTILERLERDRR